jgi:hypothetical protein
MEDSQVKENSPKLILRLVETSSFIDGLPKKPTNPNSAHYSAGITPIELFGAFLKGKLS